MNFSPPRNRSPLSPCATHAPCRNAPERPNAEGPVWRQLALGVRLKSRHDPSGDAAEAEADHVADSLVGAQETASPLWAASGNALGVPDANASSPISEGAQSLGEGHPLDPVSRAFFEARLGTDLSPVRIHTGPRAESAARGLGARAFTLGRDVAFAEGEYRPGSRDGQQLLAHELVHVAQQARQGPSVQCQDAPTSTTAPVAPAAPAGTLADVVAFVTRPGDEPDAVLQAAMGLWSRYTAQVRVANVSFRLLPESERESHLGGDHRIGGRSHWEGATPVIELPQVILDDIAEYLRVRGTPAATAGETETPTDAAAAASVRFQRAPLERAHEAVRLLGHELHHLWRVKEGHSSNPLQDPYQQYAQREMDRVRANWVEWLRDAPAPSRREMGVPVDLVIRRWEDIPEPVRRSIESGVADLDVFAGVYQRSAYLVEEIYTRIEEISYLRVQQRDPTETVLLPSRSEVSQIASIIYFLNNVLHSVEDPDGIVTPERLRRTEIEMLAYLRRRFPSSAGAQYDSYEVIFFLAAIRGGLPPHFSGGRLISHVPGARLPP